MIYGTNSWLSYVSFQKVWDTHVHIHYVLTDSPSGLISREIFPEFVRCPTAAMWISLKVWKSCKWRHKPQVTLYILLMFMFIHYFDVLKCYILTAYRWQLILMCWKIFLRVKGMTVRNFRPNDQWLYYEEQWTGIFLYYAACLARVKEMNVLFMVYYRQNGTQYKKCKPFYANLAKISFS